jgi:hypothetical protein
MADDDDACWICLAGPEAEEAGCGSDHHPHAHPNRAENKGSLGPLLQVCACPRKVHASCSARWQLHSAGKR